MAYEHDWPTLDAARTIEALGSARTGLSEEEAQERLSRFGPNELSRKKRSPLWLLFLEQFKSFLIIILLIAVAISAVLGEVTDAVIIGVIILFACGLGFVQEYRAERAMEALRQMAAPMASVLRGGTVIEVPARDLVPGDIVLLETGDRVPADGRLIEAVNLRTDEAPLTGESVAIEKTHAPLEGRLNIGDRRNMVFMGTAAVYGRGTAIVTATGMATEFGRIAGLLQEVRAERTPLQINLDRVGKWIAIVALSLTFVLAGLGVLRGHSILEMFIWGTALAVAAVPEALPAVVVISLALGVRRMVKRHALIRRLPAVETLGATTFICSDKTGTLTQNQMTVRRAYTKGHLFQVTGTGYEPKGEFLLNSSPTHGKDPGLEKLLRIGALCNDASLISNNGTWSIKGDPTEGSLVVASAKAGLRQEDLQNLFPRVDEVPFSSERKRMSTIHQTPEGRIAYSKGAPEVIVGSCSRVLENGQVRDISSEDRHEILSVSQAMADEALRVLAFAYKPATADSTGSEMEQGMTFAGLVGIIDPPRKEAKEAIKLCNQAGIKSVMITGDHKLTATAIARELGLLNEGLAVSGAEMDNLSDEALGASVERIEVYARVSPAHKLRVVEALTKRGHVVAMTGDGINDAPALKKADIGIAMGVTGTDVAKEAASMILTDDNFASIVAAVEEGRGIFSNIKKYLTYLLSANIGEILLMASAILLGSLIGLPYGAIPLIAIQILYVNLATDGLPAIALAVDPPDPTIMSQKPRPRGQGIFTKPVVILMTIAGVWSAVANLGVFKWALDSGRDLTEAQGLTFITLVITEFLKAYAFRSDKRSILEIGFFSNKWLNLAVLWEILLLILIVYAPFLQGPFHTFPVGLSDWVVIILVAATILPVIEITKAAIRLQEKRALSRRSSVSSG